MIYILGQIILEVNDDIRNCKRLLSFKIFKLIFQTDILTLIDLHNTKTIWQNLHAHYIKTSFFSNWWLYLQQIRKYLTATEVWVFFRNTCLNPWWMNESSFSYHTHYLLLCWLLILDGTIPGRFWIFKMFINDFNRSKLPWRQHKVQRVFMTSVVCVFMCLNVFLHPIQAGLAQDTSVLGIHLSLPFQFCLQILFWGLPFGVGKNLLKKAKIWSR